MRLKQLMVAHTLRSVRGILKRFILSEFCDAEITEASSEEEVLTCLDRKPFDVTLVDGELLFSGNPSLHKRMRTIPTHTHTPLVAVTASDSTEKVKLRLTDGLERCLAVPFSALELKEMINTLCDSRSWRVHDRFNIPNAEAILHLDRNDVSAELININMGGLLCDLEYSEQPLDLLSKISITIKPPPPYERFRIEEIMSRLSRLSVIRRHPDYGANCLRMTFVFESLSKSAQNTLARFIERVKENQQQEVDQLV